MTKIYSCATCRTQGFGIIALQETRILHVADFLHDMKQWCENMAGMPMLKLRLIWETCVSISGEPTGGVGFLIKEDLITIISAGTVTVLNQGMKVAGVHGIENFGSKIIMNCKGNKVMWSTVYIRSDPYEQEKLRVLTEEIAASERGMKHLVTSPVGDVNASTTYLTENMNQATDHGIAFGVRRNAIFEQSASQWEQLLSNNNMNEASAQGVLKFAPTRFPRGGEKGGPSKLDVLCASNELTDNGIVQDVCIRDSAGIDMSLSDHKMLCFNLHLTTSASRKKKLYKIKEQYKTETLQQPMHAKKFRKGLNEKLEECTRILRGP